MCARTRGVPRDSAGVRHAFVQEAVLTMEPEGDIRAPGAAITRTLCAHWDHEPPCPLAPHHTHAERVGDHLDLRVLFVVEPDQENAVRQRILVALEQGRQADPQGVITRWRLVDCHPGEVTREQEARADRLMR